MAAVLAALVCIWFFTGNTTIQGDAIDRLVISSIPRMDLQKETENPEDIQMFAGRWNQLPCYPSLPPLGNGTIGWFRFRTRETGNVHRVFITGSHTITFDNRPYYTPVDLGQWFPELYQSLEDVLEEPFSYETSS
ncbi:hypothetical protein I4000191A8_02980 [Clostridia bacterium i40-0019-1A8]